MNLPEISWIFFLIMAFETVSLSNSTEDHMCSRVEKLVSHKIWQLNISAIILIIGDVESIIYIQRETFT